MRAWHVAFMAHASSDPSCAMTCTTTRMPRRGIWDVRTICSSVRRRVVSRSTSAGVWRPKGGRQQTSMASLSTSSLRASTCCGPYTAAMTTERSVQRHEEGWVGEYSTRGCRGCRHSCAVASIKGKTSGMNEGGATTVRCVPCSQRADPCARSSGSRSVLSCRIIAGLRPSVRTTGAAAMTTVALCSLRRRADFLLGRKKSRRSLKVRD